MENTQIRLIQKSGRDGGRRHLEDTVYKKRQVVIFIFEIPPFYRPNRVTTRIYRERLDASPSPFCPC